MTIAKKDARTGYVYISFESEEEKQRVQTIYTGKFGKPIEGSLADLDRLWIVFVRGLNAQVSKKDVEEMCASIPYSVTIKKDHDDATAFAYFLSKDEADETIKIGVKEYDGGFAEFVESYNATTVQGFVKVRVAPLPRSCTPEILQKTLEKKGVFVERVSMPRDKFTRAFRGFGFVLVKGKAAAIRLYAIRISMGNVEMGFFPVEYKSAHPSEQSHKLSSRNN
jgi:RNA recognition motif-containing protein